MSVTSIPTILTLPNNCPIESVQGTIVEVYKGRNVAGGKHVQDAKLRDGSGAEIKLTIWEHPDISTFKGRDVIIQSGPKGGLKVQLDTYRQPHVNTISVSKTGTFQYLEVHNAQTGGQGNTPAVSPNAAGASGGSGGVQGASGREIGPAGAGGSGVGAITVNGAKVGMALNNACQFLVAKGVPFSSEKVFEVASELIRLSNKMEKGELAVAKEDVPY
jgi:hypothetical protein